MKTLKITFLLALFSVVSSQTYNAPSQKENQSLKVETKKSNNMELDLLAHSVSARQKDSLVVYPLLMGMLFTALLLVYIYLVMPFVLPGFM